MKLTEDQFCKAVDTLEKMVKQERTLLDALGNLCPEWIPGTWIDEYYKLLHEMCELEDTPFGTDLDFYCFDLDFGWKWEPGKYMIDGEDIPCRDSEELWSLIMKHEDKNLSSLEKAKTIIDSNIEDARYGLFSFHNAVGDHMTNIYNDENLTIDICYKWGYFEVFGLTKEEFKELKEFYDVHQKIEER